MNKKVYEIFPQIINPSFYVPWGLSCLVIAGTLIVTQDGPLSVHIFNLVTKSTHKNKTAYNPPIGHWMRVYGMAKLLFIVRAH